MALNKIFVRGMVFAYCNDKGEATGVMSMNAAALGVLVRVLVTLGKCDEFVKMFSLIKGSLKSEKGKAFVTEAPRARQFARQVVSALEPALSTEKALAKEIMGWFLRQEGKYVCLLRFDDGKLNFPVCVFYETDAGKVWNGRRKYERGAF